MTLLVGDSRITLYNVLCTNSLIGTAAIDVQTIRDATPIASDQTQEQNGPPVSHVFRGYVHQFTGMTLDYTQPIYGVL